MEIKPVDITTTALTAIERIMEAKNIPAGYGLRIGVADKTVSCGATRYTLGFDKPASTDMSYAEGSLKVLVKKIDAIHVAGLTLDYVTEDEVSGFSFIRNN
jgi:iron-sulfur cluster assembly protein